MILKLVIMVKPSSIIHNLEKYSHLVLGDETNKKALSLILEYLICSTTSLKEGNSIILANPIFPHVTKIFEIPIDLNLHSV